MANKIQIRRGLKSAMPQGSAGEPLYATDTRELFVGTGSGNVNMGGSHWYRGTAISGTSTTANAYSYAACPDVKVDDIYLNTSNGNVYACTTAGSGTTAKWTYQGCIKGTKGDTGSYFPSNDYTDMDELTMDVGDMITEHLAPPTTITIGCMDSKHQWLCDFHCQDGDNTTVFQQAINALPNGGKISILEGTYTISSKLTCNKNVIFEGMGDGTVINCTTHAFLYNTEVNHRIVIKDMKFNNTGGFTNTNKFIQCTNSDLVIDNCTISAVVSSINVDTSDYITTTGNLTVTNSDISYDIQTYSNLQCTSFIGSQSSGKTILISNSNIALYNCYNVTISITSGATYDAYILREGGTISCCKITCRGKANNTGSFKGIANISRAANIVNCPYIDLNNQYASINSYGGSVRDDCVSELIGNTIELYSSYIGASCVMGNKFIKRNTGTVYFNHKNSIVMGNRIINSGQNDFSATYGIIFQGNVLRYSCNISSLSTSIIADNIVDNYMLN